MKKMRSMSPVGYGRQARIIKGLRKVGRIATHWGL
jgi:hypothetical protein